MIDLDIIGTKIVDQLKKKNPTIHGIKQYWEFKFPAGSSVYETGGRPPFIEGTIFYKTMELNENKISVSVKHRIDVVLETNILRDVLADDLTDVRPAPRDRRLVRAATEPGG